MIIRSLLGLALMSATVVGAQEAATLPVTRHEAWQAVAAYLRAQGFAEEQLPKAGDVELPAAMPAAKQRTLRVTSACWDKQLDRAAFRLECREAGACLPFLVLGGITQAAFRALRTSPETGIAAACSPQAAARAGKSARPEIVVRPGDRATVVLRGAQLRLSAQVTCIERGAAGDMIRVRNADGVLFRARVIGPGLLEAPSQ